MLAVEMASKIPLCDGSYLLACHISLPQQRLASCTFSTSQSHRVELVLQKLLASIQKLVKKIALAASRIFRLSVSAGGNP